MRRRRDIERAVARLRRAGVVVRVDGHRIRGGARMLQASGWTVFTPPFAIETTEEGWWILTGAMHVPKSMPSLDAAVEEAIAYCRRDSGSSKGAISSESNVNGGSPTLGGTRLSCGNIVEILGCFGMDEALRIHDYLSENEFRMAVGYCARQECRARGEEAVYCQGWTLDSRPVDEGETRSDLWKLAEKLTDRP